MFSDRGNRSFEPLPIAEYSPAITNIPHRFPRKRPKTSTLKSFKFNHFGTKQSAGTNVDDVTVHWGGNYFAFGQLYGNDSRMVWSGSFIGWLGSQRNRPAELFHPLDNFSIISWIGRVLCRPDRLAHPPGNRGRHQPLRIEKLAGQRSDTGGAVDG